MKDNKEDLRIRRTHKLLREAMFSLLETRSFDDISVVDICERAMVHRATFYKHFEDKYDFMEYLTREKLREFYDNAAAEQMPNDPRDAYSIIIENVMNFVESNKKMLLISSHGASKSYFDYIQSSVCEEIKALLLSHRSADFAIPVDILAQFLTGGLIAIVRWWLRNEGECTRDEMIIHLKTLLLSNGRVTLPK